MPVEVKLEMTFSFAYMKSKKPFCKIHIILFRNELSHFRKPREIFFQLCSLHIQ